MEICNSCPSISEDDLQAAIRELGTYVDVTSEDLLKIYILAVRHARKRRSTVVPVRLLMTEKVISVTADQSLHDAAQLMSDHRIKGMPVVDGNKRVIGIVSVADIPQGEIGHQQGVLLSFLRRPFAKSGSTALIEKRVKDIMQTPAITVEPDADLQEVAAVLDMHRIRRLPVVDHEGRLLGIISRGDVIRSMAKKS